MSEKTNTRQSCQHFSPVSVPQNSHENSPALQASPGSQGLGEMPGAVSNENLHLVKIQPFQEKFPVNYQFQTFSGQE